MVGKTNAIGDPQSFNSIRFTYTVGSDVFKVQNGKTYKNNTETSSGLPFSITTSGTLKHTWQIKFTKSGTLKFQLFPLRKIDVFCVGGGGGACASNGWNGIGGGGGYTKTGLNKSVTLNTNYSIVIGAGGKGINLGTAKDGGASSAFSVTANGGKGAKTTDSGNTNWPNLYGGNGGSGGGVNAAGGTNGGDGSTSTSLGIVHKGTGQGTTTGEFGNSSATKYGAGGSGTSHSTPSANTGHGGNSDGAGGFTAGASGVVIIRNKR